MENPCEICIVNASCTERCTDFAKYIYENKIYDCGGELSKKKIEHMSYPEAIEYILMIENVILSIQ